MVAQTWWVAPNAAGSTGLDAFLIVAIDRGDFIAAAVRNSWVDNEPYCRHIL